MARACAEQDSALALSSRVACSSRVRTSSSQAPTLKRASTRPARDAASRMRSGDVMNETRKKPSPPAPKDEPGNTITPSSSIRSSANSALGMCSGNAIHKYMVPFGDSQSKPFSRNAATAASRLSLNTARFRGTNSSQSSSAEAAARHTRTQKREGRGRWA